MLNMGKVEESYWAKGIIMSPPAPIHGGNKRLDRSDRAALTDKTSPTGLET